MGILCKGRDMEIFKDSADLGAARAAYEIAKKGVAPDLKAAEELYQKRYKEFIDKWIM